MLSVLNLPINYVVVFGGDKIEMIFDNWNCCLAPKRLGRENKGAGLHFSGKGVKSCIDTFVGHQYFGCQTKCRMARPDSNPSPTVLAAVIIGSGLELSVCIRSPVVMSRPLRITFPGALYHMTSRGKAQAAIYADEVDRRAFLEGFGGQVCT